MPSFSICRDEGFFVFIVLVLVLVLVLALLRVELEDENEDEDEKAFISLWSLNLKNPLAKKFAGN
jgi:hypothetical protein